jgi:hypothetical protein
MMARAFFVYMVNKIIDFVKSTAFVLGYLFAVATAYYLSFWGYFDIDAFQFLSVEDIIKGIAYPLRYADVGIIGIFLFFVVVYTFIAFTKIGDRFTFWFLLIVVALLLTLAGSAIRFFKYYDASSELGIGITTLLTMFLIILYLIIDGAYEEDKNKAKALKKVFNDEHPAISFKNIIILFALIFFPINAIIAGQVNARDIHDGKKFNYIMRQDLPKDKISIRYDLLIFLGAVSEKYVFINRNESERFVIDKSELPALRISHFDASNKETVNHLSGNLVAQFNAEKKEAEKKTEKKEVEEKTDEKK